MTVINGAIRINRTCAGDGDFMTLRLIDRDAKITFAEVRLDYEQYGQVLASSFDVPVQIEVDKLDKVGLAFEREPASVNVPGWLSKEEAKNYLRVNCQREGWTLDEYLGSQSSISRSNEVTTIRFSYIRHKVK